MERLRSISRVTEQWVISSNRVENSTERRVGKVLSPLLVLFYGKYFKSKYFLEVPWRNSYSKRPFSNAKILCQSQYANF